MTRPADVGNNCARESEVDNFGSCGVGGALDDENHMHTIVVYYILDIRLKISLFCG